MTEVSKYQKITPIEHVLLRPEMYVGSIETQPTPMFVFDPEKSRMVWETMQVNHGLLKIVDEILLNASDNINNSKGSARQTYISVHISDAGEFTIENDGAGIPIARSKEHRMYIPEMVFGHLLTSSNYNNDATSTTAGRHGYGAKLTNILSTKFSVMCRTKGREFHMSWTDHMRKATAPRVSSADPREKNCTRIKFMPDYAHFGYTENKLSLDMKRVLHKRIMDLAAMFSSITVRLNGTAFGFKSFADYANLYAQTLPSPPAAAAASSSSSAAAGGSSSNTADVAVAPALPAPFVYTSRNGSIAFVPQLTASAKRVVGVVNGVVTYNGGTHCNAAADILNSALDSIARAMRKDGKVVDTARVARHFTTLIFLVQAQPKFDSQNKARLVSVVTMPRVPRAELEAYLQSMPFLEANTNSVTDQLALELNKEMGAGRRASNRSLIASITKLVDATSARTDGVHTRTLIVTEGDSAKALALNSLSSEQKRYCGVYPLRGKLLNVRNRNLKRLKQCKELQDLFCALGLELGKVYKDTHELRYQRLLVMTDQDADGSHIKGLVINAFESLWPQLLQRNPGFVSLFSTPLVKIRLHHTRGQQQQQQILAFYSFKDFHRWQRANPEARYSAKYYKGLGTSTTAEGKEYFADMERNIMKLSIDVKDHKLLDSVFDSAEVEWRKEWMTKANAFSGEVDIDRSKKTLTIPEFVHKEMVHFALVGNARAIAHSVDGLKPSQRKILWAILRRGVSGDAAKVAQLSGYISEVSLFHHGENSLQETMIKMAQNFTGGNNINLLVPEGQFGSRQQLGADHAAPRYIFTKLSRFARMLFPEDDDPLLDYVSEEGTFVEPNHYVPLLPMLLCNGSVGIGFGFASNIPPFHPLDVAAAVRAMITGESAKQVMRRLVPWAVGYQGTVRRGPEGEFVAVGRYMAYKNGRFHITELPWPTSIESFRLHVSTLASRDVVQRIADYSGANHVDIDLIVREGMLTTWAECETDLSLTQRIYVNGTVFSPAGTLSPLEGDLSPILQWHYDRRLDLYKKRRARQLSLLERELARLQSTHRFVEHFRQGKIDFVSATDETLVRTCVKLNMVRVDDAFDYVLRKPITFFTRTSLEKLQADIAATREKIELMKHTTPVKMWLGELDRFEKAYIEYERVLLASIRKELRPAAITAGEEVPALRQPMLELEPVPSGGSRGGGEGGASDMRVRAARLPRPPESKRASTAFTSNGGGGASSSPVARGAAAAGAAAAHTSRRADSAAAAAATSSRRVRVAPAQRVRAVRRIVVDFAARQLVTRLLPRMLLHMH